MKKPQELEAWGRSKARQRYQAGGDVPPIQQEPSPLEPALAQRGEEIDAFISEVMRDQIKKMRDED